MEIKQLAMKYIILILSLLSLNSCMDRPRSYEKRNRKVNTPEKLFTGEHLKVAQAIYNGDSEEVEKLLMIDNIQPNTIDAKGELTFLSYAIMMEDLTVMEKLLELGADPDLASPNHLKTSTPIADAAARHNTKMLNLLFKYNVNPNPEIGPLPLDEALMGDNEKETIEYLINKGADINLTGFIDGRTVVQTAVNLGKTKYINYFLDKGANAVSITSNGTCLAYDVQEEINKGGLNKKGLIAYNKIKERLINEFNVEFPVKQEKRKGMELRIQRYEDLSEKSKSVLGTTYKEINDDLKDSLLKGVNGMGDPLDE